MQYGGERRACEDLLGSYSGDRRGPSYTKGKGVVASMDRLHPQAFPHIETHALPGRIPDRSLPREASCHDSLAPRGDDRYRLLACDTTLSLAERDHRGQSSGQEGRTFDNIYKG